MMGRLGEETKRRGKQPMGFHLSFQDFGRHYAGLSKEDFFARFPTPILVIDFEGVRDVPDDVETQEQPLRPAALTQFTPGHDEKLAQVVVAPLLKSDRNTMPGVVTLGRIEENDIVLPHGVISKLHAVFRKDPTTGVFSVVDAKSRYGTAVNGQNLPPGESSPLKKRTTLLFARFVLAEIFPPLEFYQHMHLMLHLGREK
jgi:hypothetical protein